MNRKEWLIFGLGGILVGLWALMIILTSDLCESLYDILFSHCSKLMIIITPCGFVLIAWLIHHYVPEAKGGGISQTLLALHDSHPLENPLLSTRALFGKLLLIPSYIFGASLGYEGPIVQMGAAVMLQLSRYLNVTRADLLKLAIIGGSGGGLAAAFGAPLSGIVFAIEELNQKNLSAFSYSVLTAILISGLLCEMVLGHYIYLGHVVDDIDINFQGVIGYSLIPLCGVLGGVCGVLFSKTILLLVSWLQRKNFSWVSLALTTGIIVMLLNAFSHGAISGSGQNAVRDMMNQVDIIPYYALLKAIGTILTFVSGIPTGLFTPSLAIGAGIGAALSHFISSVQSQYLALLMMASFLAGTTQAPLTSFAIVMEISGADSILAPLIACSFIAFWIAGKWNSIPLYEALNLIRQKP